MKKIHITDIITRDVFKRDVTQEKPAAPLCWWRMWRGGEGGHLFLFLAPHFSLERRATENQHEVLLIDPLYRLMKRCYAD